EALRNPGITPEGHFMIPRILTLSLLLLPSLAHAAEPPALEKKSYVFKTAGEVKIHADVYRPNDKEIRPVVVWIHGGALIVGNRLSVPKNLMELCRTEGYALISIDYRLAPEVKLPEIIADVEDAFRWIQGDGAKLCHLDPNRLVITGGSAGGYLTLMCGTRLKNKPKAMVAYWGYGDVDGDWFVKPSEHYRKQPLVPKEEAYKAVRATRPIVSPSSADRRLDQGSDGLRSESGACQARSVLPRSQRHLGVSSHDAGPRHRGHRCAIRTLRRHGERVRSP
ncbi:MAG: alpha/beta hydrolase, partial [Planctomycetes bacterium]|nr:alpha/beta hydrolase [Planctomycetota bacterium]